MQENHPPRLAPPGAGLPLPQIIFAHLFLRPFVAERTPPEVSARRFEKIHALILAEIKGLTSEQLEKRVLVPPQRGLEDSSRYWSILMTLDHLMIVGQKVEAGIAALSAGQSINEKVDIAKVKPPPTSSEQEILSRFERFAQETHKRILERTTNWQSKARHRHPWFGKLSAKGWFWLMAVHGGIHLQQIKEIRKNLGGSSHQRVSN